MAVDSTIDTVADLQRILKQFPVSKNISFSADEFADKVFVIKSVCQITVADEEQVVINLVDRDVVVPPEPEPQP